MSTHCAINGCSNGDYKLMKWKENQCAIHVGSTQGLSDILLTDDNNTLFYTGCETLESFNQLHSICKPFLSKKWQGKKRTSTSICRKFKTQPSKLGRKPKLSSRDELLVNDNDEIEAGAN